MLPGLVHTAHVPRLLLAGHGQLLRQPRGLLRHEQEVNLGDSQLMKETISMIITSNNFRFRYYFQSVLCFCWTADSEPGQLYQWKYSVSTGHNRKFSVSTCHQERRLSHCGERKGCLYTVYTVFTLSVHCLYGL